MFVDVYRCLQMSMVYSHTPGGVVIFVIMLCGWGGVGWGNNVHVYLHTSDRLHYGLFPCPWTYPPTHTQLAATLWYLPLPLHNDGMLRYDILHFKPLAQSCTHTHKLDATLWYLLLRVHNLAHTLDATLWYVLLCLHNLAHTHADLMLRYDFFSCTWTILHRHLMLRYDISSCTCTILHTHTHTRCCVVISFLGQNLPMDFSATIWPSDNWPTTWKKMEHVQRKLLSWDDLNTLSMK